MNAEIFHAPSEDFPTAEQIAIDPILKYFRFRHLPPVLQPKSAIFAFMAEWIVTNVPRNAERTVALRKLLESKDAGVRACLPD